MAINLANYHSLANITALPSSISGGAMTLSNTFLDSPSSTSEQTYKIQFYCEGNTYYINGAGNDSGSTRVTSPSTITVMEVSA